MILEQSWLTSKKFATPNTATKKKHIDEDSDIEEGIDESTAGDVDEDMMEDVDQGLKRNKDKDKDKDKDMETKARLPQRVSLQAGPNSVPSSNFKASKVQEASLRQSTLPNLPPY